jgi:spermidine/putrescine transport system ATP-binding protein
MDQLAVMDIEKTYDGDPLLCGLSFEVMSGEFHCLLGRSGSGKSTLLRIIAGLETSEKGKILWNGSDVTGTPPHLRKFGLMFQDYALFPHRNVAENVAFGLEMQHLQREKIDRLVTEALERVNMGDFAKRSVAELSGGEQQRVALARSLAASPRLLMLDEPLAALDRSLRLELQQELKLLLHQANIPVIYVTHDQEEAVLLGDKLSILNKGKIIQAGTPEQVFAAPVNRWVAEFLGMENFIGGNVVSVNPLMVSTPLGIFSLHNLLTKNIPVNSKVTLIFKKDFYNVSTPKENGNLISGVVLGCDFRENGFQVALDVGMPESLVFLLPERIPIGTRLNLQIPASSITIVPG